MSFFEQSAESLGMTVSEMIAGYRFTVYGSIGIHVEGHRGVLRLTDSEIVLRQRKHSIKILGSNLTLKELTETDVFIRGDIRSVVMGEKS